MGGAFFRVAGDRGGLGEWAMGDDTILSFSLLL